MVDAIAAQYYGGTAAGQVEQVLAANPGLADYGPLLPRGVAITLPAIEAPKTTGGVKLWD
jgi:phage tail protein X